MIVDFLKSVIGEPTYFLYDSSGAAYYNIADWQYIAAVLIFLVVLWGCIKLFTVLLRSIH